MLNRKKLAIVSTHPIQYYAPVFRALARSESLDVRIFYTWSQSEQGEIHDRGFGRDISWDIPLLEGYQYEFVPNVAKRPGSDHFFGIRNPSLIDAIQHWGAHAMLVYGWNLHSHLQALRHFQRRIPVFFRGDSTLLNNDAALRTILRRTLLRWVYRHVDVAIAVGSNSRDYFRWCGISGDRVAFAPHSIENERFADPTGAHQLQALAWREQFGIAKDSVVLVFAGKLLPRKEPELLIDAFQSCEIGHLVVVGNGPLETALKQRARHNPRVHFMPFQNQTAMPAIYRMGDVFALPSRIETWGLAVNEAMASARPVIASTLVGAARDLVQEGANGWIFRSGDREDLARVLKRAMSLQQETLGEMGRAAHETIRDWSSEVSAQKISAAVEKFLRAGESFAAAPSPSALEVNC